MDKPKPDYKPQGTRLSGLEGKGPYHCGDCIHRQKVDGKFNNKCLHPIVVLDPEVRKLPLPSGKTRQHGGNWVEIDEAVECCNFVKQTGEHEPDSDDNPVKRAAKSRVS